MDKQTTVSSAKLDAFFADLARLAPGQLRTDQISRLLYSTDASIYQQLPLGVLIPQHNDTVQAAVELAARYQIPLLPRTGGSSLAGQSVNEALVIDMSRHLDQIIDLDLAAQTVTVQPGIVLDHLNLALRPHGLQFGPDPASSNRACLGGITANNSTGSHSILYGMTADHVLEANVILNDGSNARFNALSPAELVAKQQLSSREGNIYRNIVNLTAQGAETIRRGTPRHWRRCGGYNLDRFVPGNKFNYPQDGRFNLAKLLCGSEGTLGLMTDITLNLVPLPQMTALAIVHFDNLQTALEAVPIILEINPSAVELLDNLGLTLCRDVPEYARLLSHFIDGDPNCVLLTEFYGSSPAELQSRIAALQSHLQKQGAGATAVIPAYSAEAQARVWKVRKVGLGLLMSIKGDHKPIPFIEDSAVPVEHLATYINEVEQFCNSLGTEVAYYAHASAGCLHVRPLINSKSATDKAKLPLITQFAADLLGNYDGALSSEHGDGRARSWLNERFFGPELYRLYQDVKQIFDPENIFNPGNIVNAPSMTDHLRYDESYQVIPLQEQLDFSADGGFHRAVEMCNGAGICRKQTTGTMCPSFMVTREEEHSTRGRANLLRAAFSGRLPAAALTSERLHDAMDLCISCKACKAECPSSVDMAKIKTEYLAHYYAANGTPFRARFFAAIPQTARWLSGPLAPLINKISASKPARLLLEKGLGISANRPLPPFAPLSFTRWFKPRPAAPNARRVILFHDTFNTYQDPHIALTAARLLEQAGYAVTLSRHGCCGRPAISKGLIESARAQAAATISRLAPDAAAGIPIIGLEPSCLLTLRDEYHDLLPDDPRVPVVAANSFLFAEFIMQEKENGRLNLTFTDEQRTILLHGHCHEKALIGTKAVLNMLALPPNYSVTEIDSGCCGMAGSFGYEAEHEQLSLAMAERRLLPAVREAAPATLIAASGTSCRHQISYGSGREPRHPVEILAQAVVSNNA